MKENHELIMEIRNEIEWLANTAILSDVEKAKIVRAAIILIEESKIEAQIS